MGDLKSTPYAPWGGFNIFTKSTPWGDWGGFNKNIKSTFTIFKKSKSKTKKKSIKSFLFLIYKTLESMMQNDAKNLYLRSLIFF
jgi:hypothetical protein